MLAFMLDPCFKELDLLQDYIGCEVTKKVVDDYDTKVFIPILVKVAAILSPTIGAQLAAPTVLQVFHTSLFSTPASTAKAS